jgi:F-box domain
LQLLDLPEELLIRILAYLPFKSLVSYRSISHAFNSLITESTRLQYAIALETHRFINNPNSPLPLAERLRRLQAREEAWRLLKPSSNQRFDIPHHASWVHDLNGDTFLLGDTVTDEKVDGPNGWEIWGTKAVGCLSLESSTTNTWKSFDVGNDIINATMAIHEHDLIALATMCAIPFTTTYSC